MKLYDVIRKENLDDGKDLPPIPEETPIRIRTYRQSTGVRWKKILVFGGAIFFVALLYILGVKLAHAKVVVTERRIPFVLENAEFELVHEGDASTGRLTFQAMGVSSEATRQVYGSKFEQSTSMAKGKVVFFNEYSTKPQTVKAKTTLTASNGKKYQTTTAVTVPGYTLKGKVKTAGISTATAIVATAVGPTYNTTGSTFSVAGWGKSLYAQSSGAVTGGEDGVSHSVTDAERGDVIATLQSQLTERLKRETRTQIPDNLIAYPNLQVPSIDANATELRGDSVKFPATMKGTMTTYLISRDAFETAIANHVLNDHTYPHVSIPSIGDLTVTPITALPADPKHTPDSIRIRVSGEGVIITKAPLDTIRQTLIGSRKKLFGSFINTIPEVDSAEYHFYPFWAPFFPHTESWITVEAK
jgi:hypothetical protein